MSAPQKQQRFRNTVAPVMGIGLAMAAKELLARARESDLSGQVVLITGGSRGLGLALARELATHGCRLAICARDRNGLDRAAADLRANGADVLPIVCDVSVRSQVDSMIAEVLLHFGQIDAIYTAAAFIEVGEFESLTTEDFERAMDVIFWGTFHSIMAVLPHMRHRGSGQIVTISSIGGKIAVPHLLTYSTAKFAVTGFAQGLAAEMAGDGIKVTNIVPGLMRTGSHLNAQFKGDPEQQRGDYTWFALGASSPFVPQVDRAARIVVRAVRRGDVERVFSAPFDLASRVAGIAPSTAIRLTTWANRMLPDSRGRTNPPQTSSGREIRERTSSSILNALTSLGDKAANETNQNPEPTSTLRH
ncbi:MAG: SDR family oxidoreductase [Thermomicrobiales bacterium]